MWIHGSIPHILSWSCVSFSTRINLGFKRKVHNDLKKIAVTKYDYTLYDCVSLILYSFHFLQKQISNWYRWSTIPKLPILFTSSVVNRTGKQNSYRSGINWDDDNDNDNNNNDNNNNKEININRNNKSKLHKKYDGKIDNRPYHISMPKTGKRTLHRST